MSSETDLNDADLLLEEHARRAERNEETNSNRKHEKKLGSKTNAADGPIKVQVLYLSVIYKSPVRIR